MSQKTMIKEISDSDYHFCCYGHLIHTSHNYDLFQNQVRCKCGEPIFVSISRKDISKKLGSYKNLSKIKIKLQKLKICGKNISLPIYDLETLGYEYKIVTENVETIKRTEKEIIDEFKKIDVPHDAYLYFCSDHHLICSDHHLIGGHTKKDELFNPKEIKLVCVCGKSSIFCISKTRLSNMLGGAKNISRIEMRTRGVKKGKKYIPLPIYNIGMLGYNYSCKEAEQQEA